MCEREIGNAMDFCCWLVGGRGSYWLAGDLFMEISHPLSVDAGAGEGKEMREREIN